VSANSVARSKLRQVLDLGAIEASLRDLQAQFPRINQLLASRRENMDDGIVADMMAGYAFVDTLIAQRVDLFAMGHLKLLLEINALVLCGREERQRAQAETHLVATERRFYEQEGGGIRDVVEWYALHKRESPWKRAAGVYVRILSEPELFIEGNHRSGALVMSYILAREGYPPFVLTAENAKGYLDPSTLMTKARKKSIAMLYRMPRIKRYFAEFLREQADPKYLLPAPAATFVR
jgi:hypothetical protein